MDMEADRQMKARRRRRMRQTTWQGLGLWLQAAALIEDIELEVCPRRQRTSSWRCAQDPRQGAAAAMVIATICWLMMEMRGETRQGRAPPRRA